MSWSEKMKEFGGGAMSFLSEDGEAIMFVVVGEPVLLEGKYKGKPTEKIGCPAVTLEGFTLLVIGKRLARRLAKYESDFDKYAFIAIRHGEPEDRDAKYELKKVDNPELTKQLFNGKAGVDYTEEIQEAVVAVQDTMKQ